MPFAFTAGRKWRTFLFNFTVFSTLLLKNGKRFFRKIVALFLTDV